jgi:microcystin-dependent protein
MTNYYNILSSSRPNIGDTKIATIPTDHNGWLICDGRELLIAANRSLFAVIGYQFGGSGEYFKLPNAAGRVPGITGTGEDLTERQVGDIVGEETHTLDISEIPQHNHTASSVATNITMNANGSHSHTGTTTTDGTHTHSINDPSHTHTQTTINDDYNNSGANPPGFSADSAGSQTWNNINSSTTGITINSNGAHNHTFTTSTESSHTHTINDPTHTHSISNTGGSQPHNNMQPTIFIGNLFIYKGLPIYGISSAGGYSWF